MRQLKAIRNENSDTFSEVVHNHLVASFADLSMFLEFIIIFAAAQYTFTSNNHILAGHTHVQVVLQGNT